MRIGFGIWQLTFAIYHPSWIEVQLLSVWVVIMFGQNNHDTTNKTNWDVQSLTLDDHMIKNTIQF
jgi:hypothetical protein